MKIKTIYFSMLFMVMLGLCSCEETIPIELNEQEPKLLMNANFDLDKEVNTVYVNLSGASRFYFMHDGTLEVYVNGNKEMTIKGEPVKLSDSRFGYELNAPALVFEVARRFQEGDRVQLVAKVDGNKYTASAETVFPIRPNDLTITDRYVERKSDDYTKYEMEVNVAMNDLKNTEDAYRLGIRMYYRIKGKSLHTGQDTVMVDSRDLSVDINDDLILNDGEPRKNDMVDDGLFLFERPDNRFFVFNDHLFANRQANIRFYVDQSALYYNGDKLMYLDDKAEITIDAELTVACYHIPNAYEDYLRRMNVVTSNDYDDSFMEAIILKSNVTGGYGMVNAESKKEAVVVKKTKVEHGIYTINWK